MKDVVQFTEILPFATEHPSFMNQHNFQHVLHIVRSFAVLLYQSTHDLHVHSLHVRNYHVWHVEGFCVLEAAYWLLALFREIWRVL
jgi:hypothetical protein